MTFPAIIFGIVLAALLGALFHIWKGGSIAKLFLFILLSLTGFLVGHLVGNALKVHFVVVGTLNAGMAIVGSVIFLLLGEWLSRVEISRN